MSVIIRYLYSQPHQARMSGTYIDLHCHPALKGFGKSFKYRPVGKNDPDPKKRNSIWKARRPSFMERWLNRMISLTKFTQTDLATLATSGVDVVVVSLYPFEKHFLTKRILGWKGLTDVLVNLAAGISQKRIDHVRNHRDYYEDLLLERDYYLQLDGKVVELGGKRYAYRIVSNYQQIEQNRLDSKNGTQIISLILSIEGAHVLNTGLDMNANTADEEEVLRNLEDLMSWPIPPLFITFAHHFYNELCGHAPSINLGLIRNNQNHGLDSGFTPLGWKVMERLLLNAEAKPVLIDLKHMSVQSRREFYNWLDRQGLASSFPILVSHGGVNGLQSFENPQEHYPARTGDFKTATINFYDEELHRIARSGGLFGIQLDERRIGSKKAIRRSKRLVVNKQKQFRRKALLVWKQVEHMAEVLNGKGLFAWGLQAIGSDFDGIVDPINGLWTAAEMDQLAEALLHHAQSYLETNNADLIPENRIKAKEVVDRLMWRNADDFLRKNF